MATIKHFIGDESEYRRMSMSSDIEPRALHEIYLPPFEAAVKRARTWAVLSSYNKVNGAHVLEQMDLISGICCEQWDYDGLVMSDWFGIRRPSPSIAARTGKCRALPTIAAQSCLLR